MVIHLDDQLERIVNADGLTRQVRLLEGHGIKIFLLSLNESKKISSQSNL